MENVFLLKWTVKLHFTSVLTMPFNEHMLRNIPPKVEISPPKVMVKVILGDISGLT